MQVAVIVLPVYLRYSVWGGQRNPHGHASTQGQCISSCCTFSLTILPGFTTCGLDVSPQMPPCGVCCHSPGWRQQLLLRIDGNRMMLGSRQWGSLPPPEAWVRARHLRSVGWLVWSTTDSLTPFRGVCGVHGCTLTLAPRNLQKASWWGFQRALAAAEVRVGLSQQSGPIWVHCPWATAPWIHSCL
jgi:hypothetical protein